MFHFKITLQVYHDDREVEFILFKRELEKQYDNGTLQLDYKSCEMMADDIADSVSRVGPYDLTILRLHILLGQARASGTSVQKIR